MIPLTTSTKATPVKRRARGGDPPRQLRSGTSRLRSNTAPARPRRAAEDGVHVVAKGDNPYSIAKKLHVSYNDLIATNEIKDPTKIQIGQKLKDSYEEKLRRPQRPSISMRRNAIHVLLLTVACLTALGMVMLFSISAFAPESHGDIYLFVKRQGVWLGIAVVGATVAACIDYNWWKRTWWIFFGVAFVLADPVLRAADRHEDQRLQPLDQPGGIDLSAERTGQDRRHLFHGLVVPEV